MGAISPACGCVLVTTDLERPSAGQPGWTPSGPGSSEELLRTGKPTLVVQGERDPFGRPDEFPKLPPDIELVAIPSENHMLVSETRDAEPDSLEHVTAAVVEWLSRVTASMRPAPPADTPLDQG